MTSLGSVAPSDFWLPRSGRPWGAEVLRPLPGSKRRLTSRIAGQWHRIVIEPLLAIDRAGIIPEGRVLGSALDGQKTGGQNTFSTTASDTAGSAGSRTSKTEISSPSEIHDLEPAAQLTYLVENYSDAVYRVARSVVRENELAEDASQEALLKAWQALPTFRGDAPLRNWVLRITHNTAVSILRSRREEVRDPELLPDSVQGGTVERSVEDTFAMSAFEDALGELDELSRSIVVLREIENMSYDEISEVLDVPLPTVKTRLLRARKVLSSALTEWRP